MTSVTLVLSLILLCWKLCAATAAIHRLAYWWVQAHNTIKVWWLLCFFRRERRSSDNTWDCPIFDNFRRDFSMIVVAFWRAEELAIQESLCTDTWLQFTAPNVTCKGLIIARKCPIIHGDRKSMNYSTIHVMKLFFKWSRISLPLSIFPLESIAQWLSLISWNSMVTGKDLIDIYHVY